MCAKRLESGVVRPLAVTVLVDGQPLQAYPGESLAAALLAGDCQAFRSARDGQPRGPFCNMGVCFECVVTVDGVQNVRACMTPVRSGLTVTRQMRAPGQEVSGDGER